ncbi:MAG: hypothetical protein ABL907_21890 [Hyphomicrobium sp.]
MANLVLTIDGTDPLENPTLIAVRWALYTVRPSTETYVCLHSENGSFVRCKGALDELHIEWREVRDDGLVFYRLLGRCGRFWRQNQHMLKPIDHQQRPIETAPDQILDLTDALVIFECFFEKQRPPYWYQPSVLKNVN